MFELLLYEQSVLKSSRVHWAHGKDLFLPLVVPKCAHVCFEGGT